MEEEIRSWKQLLVSFICFKLIQLGAGSAWDRLLDPERDLLHLVWDQCNSWRRPFIEWFWKRWQKICLWTEAYDLPPDIIKGYFNDCCHSLLILGGYQAYVEYTFAKGVFLFGPKLIIPTLHVVIDHNWNFLPLGGRSCNPVESMHVFHRSWYPKNSGFGKPGKRDDPKATMLIQEHQQFMIELEKDPKKNTAAKQEVTLQSFIQLILQKANHKQQEKFKKLPSLSDSFQEPNWEDLNSERRDQYVKGNNPNPSSMPKPLSVEGEEEEEEPPEEEYERNAAEFADQLQSIENEDDVADPLAESVLTSNHTSQCKSI